MIRPIILILNFNYIMTGAIRAKNAVPLVQLASISLAHFAPTFLLGAISGIHHNFACWSPFGHPDEANFDGNRTQSETCSKLTAMGFGQCSSVFLRGRAEADQA